MIWLLRIDMADAQKRLASYTSVHDVFTRRLRAGARTIDTGIDTLVAPVDARVIDSARVNFDVLPQAKGKTYSLSALLVDKSAPQRFVGGGILKLYLSPRDYHRVHSPVTGKIVRCVYVSGAVFPVHNRAVQSIDNLYTRNERLIIELFTEYWGAVVVVMVGATFVGGLRTSFAWPQPAGADTQHTILKGDELGTFEMGSTVVLVTERPVRWWVHQGAVVKMGQVVGRPQERTL
ncbi:MAG: phosphatidylserine decarboxylase [Myxococcales bacterium]|nr:phosphatidylserine decarboxylase [Myxococcales bacterium]